MTTHIYFTGRMLWLKCALCCAVASGGTPGTVNSGWPQSVSSQATSPQTFSREFRSSLPKVDFPVPLLPHTAAVACPLSPALASCMAALIPEAACMST